MIHQGILKYRNARYLWWGLMMTAGSFALYFTQGGSRPASGGTWQGYVLGTLGALLIVWLSWLGVRKRSYDSTLGTLRGWTSAHVYLGLALLFIATLHCAAQFGFNVHTLAYVLMCAVIGSGIVGVYAYVNVPNAVSDNHSGGGRPDLFAELYRLNSELAAPGRRVHPAVAAAIASSIERTVIGGGALAQLFGRDASLFLRPAADDGSGGAQLLPNADQQAVIDFVGARLPRADKAAEVPQLQQLLVLLSRRQAVLRRIRRDIRLRGWLQVWLYVHVPLTVALLGALLVHILSTFLYW